MSSGLVLNPTSWGICAVLRRAERPIHILETPAHEAVVKRVFGKEIAPHHQIGGSRELGWRALT